GVLMLAVVLPIIWFLIQVKPEDIGLKPLGSEISTTNQVDVKEQTQAVDLSVSQTLTKPFFLLLVIGTTLLCIVNNGGLAQFPPVLTSLHGAGMAATVISVYSAVGIIGKLVLGNISDRFGVLISTIYASCTLLVLTYFAMMFANNVIIAMIMGVLFGM